MLSTTRTRAALTALAVVAATLLASCETPPPPPPPVVAAPPAPPPITLSSSIVEKASAFRGYMQRAGAIGATFENGDQIQASLKIGVGYEPKQFLSGATAYAAVLALQDPTYVASVRAFAADPAQRQQVINQIIADPAYVVGFKGSDTAAGRIIDTLGAGGLKLYAAGKAVKQSAYDIQRAKWSTLPVLDRDGRLAYAKTMSATPALADSADMDQLKQASTGGVPLVDAPRAAAPPYKPLVIRGMAVAALAALGYAGDDKLEIIDAVMAEPASAMCLNMAKLNLYQCLAVAKPHYEDVFCLGQHIMIDTGVCVIKASGAEMPYEPPRVLPVKESISVKGAGSNSRKAKAAAGKPTGKKKS